MTTDQSIRRLFLLRHAKAGFGTTDKSRPLAKRGIKDSTWLGQHLSAINMLPDHILCSSAERTRETMGYLQKGAEKTFPASFSDDLYLASAETILNHILSLHDDIKAPMIIGHNPGIAILFHHLAGNTGAQQRIYDYPTCCLGVFEWQCAGWQDITSHARQLKLALVASDERRAEKENKAEKDK